MCPDITMCSGQECPKKDTCFRYLAKPSEYRQSLGLYWENEVGGEQ